MTNDEVTYHYNRMLEIWGDSLPNLEQEPIRFAYYVKLYKAYHMKEYNGST
jgi:hypothetical protein